MKIDLGPIRISVPKNKLSIPVLLILLVLFVISTWQQPNVLNIPDTPQPTSTLSPDTTQLISPEPLSATSEAFLVSRVIDGDTIELANGEKVRYIGIDTPEKKQDECFNQEATQKNKELVEGKMVQLVSDVSNRDRYGRLLRYVYVDDTFVNDLLVKQGFAQATSYPPDIKYQDLFSQSQRIAQEKNLGLWSSCH